MIRLICVGLGGMGHHDWNSAIDSGGFKAVAGVDVQQEARDVFAAKTGAPTFTDFSEALQATSADAALIATPDAFHAPLALCALAAGLDVISEKPMAETLKDAAQMHYSAVDQGRMLMVHHQLRWNPSHHEARRLIDAGTIGTVRRLDFHFSVHSDVCLRGYRSKLPYLILQDLAIHHFDLVRYLSGQECDSLYVSAWPALETDLTLTAATDAVAVLNMSGPVTASYTASIRELIDPVGYTCKVHIVGSDGQLQVDSERLILQTHAAHAAGIEPQLIDPVPPVVGTWQAFAQALETRQPTWTHSGDNLKSLSMLFAAIESAQTGMLVQPTTDFAGLLKSDD